MRILLFLLALGLAPAASAQMRYPYPSNPTYPSYPGYYPQPGNPYNPGYPGQPITIGRPGYACTAVGYGPMGYRSFEATAFGPNYQVAYSQAYSQAIARCQYAQRGYGYGYGYPGSCRVTQCNRVYF